MAFNFTIDDRTLEWKERIRAYVDEFVIPREQRGFASLTEDFRRELQAEAQRREIWAPQLPTDLGGGGFSFDQAGVLLEESGRSLFGPLGIYAAAPDEGNLHLLNVVATPEQRKTWLEPLANGDIRSCFVMTEPAPGAGSDPMALRTEATRTEAG